MSLLLVDGSRGPRFQELASGRDLSCRVGASQLVLANAELALGQRGPVKPFGEASGRQARGLLLSGQVALE